MSWLAISDGQRCLRLPPADAALVPLGSLLIEVQPSGDRAEPATLLRLERRAGWRHRFAVTLSPAGDVIVEHRQGASTFVAALRAPRVMAHDVLRLTFSWDAPGRIATLSVENTASGRIRSAHFERPHPLDHDDIAALCEGAGGAARIDPAVSLIAVSDRIEPVGPMPGFLHGSRIDTGAGPRAVETLVPGDLVPTAAGRLLPVRAVVSREVPALGQFRPVRLRAPFLGLRDDLTLAPHHRVLIDGTDTEYLFGAEAALIEARHLGPMIAPVPPRTGPTAHYAQILLDGHDCLRCQGAWTESLYIGRLARRPARLARSVLAGSPARRLPVHDRVAGPLLKSFEAKVLVSNLCA